MEWWLRWFTPVSIIDGGNSDGGSGGGGGGGSDGSGSGKAYILREELPENLCLKENI